MLIVLVSLFETWSHSNAHPTFPSNEARKMKSDIGVILFFDSSTKVRHGNVNFGLGPSVLLDEKQFRQCAERAGSSASETTRGHRSTSLTS